jgi:DnaK suppressor protein
MSADHAEPRARLEAELHGLREAIDAGGESAATVELDQTRVGRLSRMDAMQQQAMAQGTRWRLDIRRRKVEAALARITAGTYGLCCECGLRLSDERLSADPAAVFCADCAAERELG